MTLNTQRLILRPWNENDAADLFEYAKDSDVGPIAGWPPHKNIQESLDVIKNVFCGKECYAVCLKENNRAVGAVELKLNGHTDMTTRDDECELGYWIGKPFWGNGYIPEAVRELLRRAFEDLKMTTVWCGYYEGNEKSKRVQQKCGFEFFAKSDNVPVPLMNEIRTGYMNRITKEMWKKMTHILVKANNEQNKIQNELKADVRLTEERPRFHFASPCGWINDPNGFSVFKNEIHLFAQYHPYSTQWGPMHWAHATSKDFVLWNIQDVALAPDTDADNDGCFSGTSFEKDGKQIIAYTGVHEEDGKTVQEQCIAIGDGKTYTKFCENPVITYKNIPFEYQRSDFRDPKIWAEGDKYFLAAVLKKKNNCGALVLFESKDLHEWNYVRLVDESRDGLSGMWECPDIFKFDGKDVIILSPQEMKEDEKLGFHDGNNSVYMTGSLDFKSAEFTREVRSENNYTAAQIDYGIDFYAPQTTLSPDGRRIMIAWMQSWESYITPKNYLWSGMMTIPREINLRNGKLYQNPVKEIENYRNKNFSGIIESSAKKQVISGLCVRQFDAEFVLSVPQNEEGKFILNIAESKDYAATIVYDAKTKKLTFDRSRTIDGGGNTKSRSMKVLPNSDGKIKLRILCDTCSAEVFVNDGEYAFTNAFFIPLESKIFSVVNTLSGNILYNAYSFTF